MVTFIAEVGVNHDGSIEKAKKLIEAAALAKADYVKFQLFSADLMCAKKTKLAPYQKISTPSENSMYDLLKKLELSYDAIVTVKKYCDQSNIKFLCTSFDLESTLFLKSIGQEVWKIPSGEITNFPYLEKISLLAKKNLFIYWYV